MEMRLFRPLSIPLPPHPLLIRKEISMSKRMQWLAKAMILAIFCAAYAPVMALETQDISQDWQVQALTVNSNADIKTCPRPNENGAAWKPGAKLGKGDWIALPEGVKRNADNSQMPYNAWYKKTVKIPAQWRGQSVRIYQEINYIELVVFVNGQKAGVICRPFGFVEISRLLRYGGDNEIRIFATNGFYGTGYTHCGYYGRDESYRNMPHIMSAMMLEARTPAYVEEVYANTSWREKKLTLRCSIESTAAYNAQLSAAISEDAGRNPQSNELNNGKVVKNAQKAIQLKPGENVVELEIPWDNPTTWEVNRPFLYNAEVKLTLNGKSCDSCPKFVFGFREIWREGKEFYLNGHIQRFRGFWNQGVPKNLADVKKHGYTISYETHKHYSVQQEDVKRLEEYARAGLCIANGMPTIYYIHDAIRTDPEAEAQYRNHFKYWNRTVLNCPAVVWTSCGVNQICPEENMQPEILGQIPGKGGVVLNIEHGCKIAREYRPNCLYYSHADGTNGDISSNNLYFNFTPLQEREEWLSSWSEKGIMPWYAAEFGAPYYACWFHDRTPQMTEWLAVYYGKQAYEKETDDLLKFAPAFARSCLKFTHGGWVDEKGEGNRSNTRELYDFHPLGYDMVKKLIYRTNRAWRAYGLNGGLMYLTAWGWDDNNPVLMRQSLANEDLVTFLGGAPVFTDRTHAYYAGEEIQKNLVFVWDGFGRKSVRANWKLVEVNSNRVFAQGSAAADLNQGDIVFKPISVIAPLVNRLASFRFEVSFDAQGIDDSVKTDSFTVDIYPKSVPRVASNEKTFAVFDPAGKSAAVLDALGMKYTKVDSIEQALANPAVGQLLIGKFALDNAQLDSKALAQRVSNGLRLIIMPQNAAVWKSMGFVVEDAMARQMWNVSLPNLDDRSLNHWRGAPDYGCAFGNVMKHQTRRGPRWTRTHTVAGLVIKIPEKAGFTPLINGEFDMNYTALLRLTSGKGAVTFCTLDFEDRIGVCPAASDTAAAAMRSFLSDKIDASRMALTSGSDAQRIAKQLGLDAREYRNGERLTNSVLIVGKNSPLNYQAVRNALGGNPNALGNRALIICNDAAAQQAGLIPPQNQKEKAEPAQIYRVPNLGNVNRFPFAGIGPNLLRWRDTLNYTKLNPVRGFTVAGNGLFAVSDDTSILFDQVEPGQLINRWNKNPSDLIVLKTVATSEEHNLQRLSRVLANWGVAPGSKTLARALYIKPVTEYAPIPNYYVLGPWPSMQDDSVYMVETVFDPLAEKMAIEGDVNPNPRFHPKGLTYEKGSEFDYIDWRPTVQSDPDGFVNLRKVRWIDTQSFCTCYCIGYVERETAGNVTLRFGVDWRGKIWVNGKEVFKTYGGGKTEGAFIVENIPLKKGKNVFTFKIGSGQTACCFYANITKEIKPGDTVRKPIADLNDVNLYETVYPEFDPYMYVYW